MNCYGMKMIVFIKKQAGKIDNVNTAAISLRKGFSTIKLLHVMLIVSIVYIAVCLEYLAYQRQSKVPNLKSPA